MQTIIRALVCLALALSVATLVVPLKAAVPQPVKAHCCAHMKMGDQQNDCGKQMPKNDQTCCAACMVGLTMFMRSTTMLFPPDPSDESFARFTLSQRLRSERPPVPPPRSALA